MVKSIVVAAGLAALALSGPVGAQPMPRSYDASPDIYRVIAQGEPFKVIAVRWAPGQKDVMHAHPANAVYYLTDCILRIHLTDGSWREAQPRAGVAIVQPPIAAHVIENIGPAECRLVMFEPS